MAVNTTEIENLYRPVYELPAVAAWLLSAAVGIGAAAAIPGMPLWVGITIAMVSIILAGRRAIQGWDVVAATMSLAGRSFWIFPQKDLDKTLAGGGKGLWLGRGFRWTPVHTQRAKTMQEVDWAELMPPKFLLKAMGYQADQVASKGEHWIHGVERNEADLFIPWSHVEGNWSILGTTGSGKTRLYEAMTYQNIRRGDVVVFFDPKFDKELRDTLKRGCVLAGRPDAFCEFHPAFPSRSVRIDPVKNFARVTEIPSRVADILGGDPGDNFVAFSWRALYTVSAGLIYVGERPSLKKLRFYVESGPESLVEKCLVKFLTAWAPGGWEDHVSAVMERISNKKFQPRLKTGTSRQQAMVQVYHDLVPNELKVEDLNGLLSVAEHGREHYGKMIAGMIPLLTQLTAAPLDSLLSPDYEDLNDRREILDMEKVISGGRVLYVATDSLADATTGSAIAAILLAELRAVAGARYNADTPQKERKTIHIYCDEAAELITPPLIAIMNKGRGAGMITYLASQNFSDYIHKFGSEDAARMALGNANNRICLRVVDTKTQQYMADSLGEVMVKQVSASQSSSSQTEKPGIEFGANIGVGVRDMAAEIFPGYLLGRLPDLHFIASVSGGKLFAGHIPKIQLGGDSQSSGGKQ